MSFSQHIRPEVSAFPDKTIHVYVGGSFKMLNLEAAESLYAKLGDAIAEVKARNEEESKP